jgi:streptogramin lyase
MTAAREQRPGAGAARAAKGWSLASTSRPRGFAGANGMRFGPDGELYVMSAFGSEIGSVNTSSGQKTVVSPPGDAIVSPDDVAFDSNGVLYATECMNARVSAYDNGRITVIADGLSGANGIGVFEDRIFIDQFLPDGKLWEVYRDDREPRLIADHLTGPNGLCIGQDRMIYFVQVFTGEVMRVPVDGGPVEEFVGGLAAPTSVRAGSDGFIYVSQNGTGEVNKIDPRTREVSTVVRSRPAIDNLDIDASGRVFLSWYTDGSVAEVVDQDTTRDLVEPGLLAPYGMAKWRGVVHVADGLGMARLLDDGSIERTSKFTDEGFPGFVRGAGSANDDALYVSTSAGAIARFDPLECTSEILVEGRHELLDVSVGPGGVLCAEAGAGQLIAVGEGGEVRVVSDEFDRPVGVAALPDGSCYVTDEARGELVHVGADGSRHVVLEGLQQPQGVAASDRTVFVVEAGAKRLRSVSLGGADAGVVASDLPVGARGGGIRETQNGLPEMIPGPMPPFAGIATDGDDRVLVSGDEVGVVLAFERAGR